METRGCDTGVTNYSYISYMKSRGGVDASISPVKIISFDRKTFRQNFGRFGHVIQHNFG